MTIKTISTLVFVLIFAWQGYASDVLVSTDWVEENLDRQDVRLVEVSVEPGQFERGHIPGAINLEWHTDLVDQVKRDLISKEHFEELLSENGIEESTTVVLYGDHNNWFAAWGAWVFTIYGHDDIRLLDGGRDKWENENRPLSSRPQNYNQTNYSVNEINDDLRAYKSDVLNIVEEGYPGRLVDIRSEAEYSGRIIAPEGVQELAVRAGHIPGAVNVPWGTIVDDDGTFLPEEELKQIYAEQGIDGDEPVITYCRIGERSSHTWFALYHILGYDTKNYDGSWTEYGNAVGVPIENPEGTVWTGK